MSAFEDVANPPRPRWADWVERNAHPKTFHFQRVSRELTPWQKRGPMTRKDWQRFYQWAAVKAIKQDIDTIKHKLKAKAEKHEKYLEKNFPESVLPKKKEQKKTKPKKLAVLLQRLEKLAVQLPRKARDKYDHPPVPVYPYSPKIHFKDPPKHDPGRPFEPPEVPKVFQHIELETDFWTKLRFSIRPSVFNYTPTENILKLAKPRVTPPIPPHCPIPEKMPEYIPKRRRMSPRQWREHMIRLVYLAKPVSRTFIRCY